MSRLLGVLGILCAVLLTGCESDLARRISAYEKTRDYEAAKALLEQTVQQQPQNAEAQYHLGRLYMREGRYEAGREALEASREASPRFGERIDYQIERYLRAEMADGSEALDDGRIRRAIRHFQAATQIQPDHATAHRALGHAFVQADQPTEAEAAYRQAHTLDADDVETLNNLAELAFQREDYEAAIEYSLQAVDPNAPEPDVIVRLAYAYVAQGELDEAEERFAQALSLQNSRALRRDYALVLFNRGKHREALEHLQALVDVEEPEPQLIRVLSESYYALENYERAVTWYRRLLDHAPDDRDALQNLVIAHEKLGQYDEAESYREQLQQVDEEAHE